MPWRDFSRLSAREHEEMRQHDTTGDHDAWEQREAERAEQIEGQLTTPVRSEDGEAER